MLSTLQAEIARAADDAVEEYNRSVPENERTATGVWEVMQTANDKAIKTIKQKDFQKYLAVANPKNGDDFFNQVCAFSLAFIILRFLCN